MLLPDGDATWDTLLFDFILQFPELQLLFFLYSNQLLCGEICTLLWAFGKLR